MIELISRYSSQPAILILILFFAPFVLEEAAILAAAVIATANLLSPQVAFLPLLLGIVASDWFLFCLGRLASRFGRIRAWIGGRRLAQGRELLGRGTSGWKNSDWYTCHFLTWRDAVSLDRWRAGTFLARNRRNCQFL